MGHKIIRGLWAVLSFVVLLPMWMWCVVIAGAHSIAFDGHCERCLRRVYTKKRVFQAMKLYNGMYD